MNSEAPPLNNVLLQWGSPPSGSKSGNKSAEAAFTASVAAVVFGDGSESGLYPLTKKRSEGAIPVAANYRLVDIAVSNCINSNITKIYALTQFNSTSLNSHLSRAYSSIGLGKDGFVEVLAAYQSPEDQDWFQGSADAVRRCLWILEEHPVMDFLVLPSYHLHRMDYQKLIQAHRSSNADITIAVSCCTRNQNRGFGFLKVDCENWVLEFKEKPEQELLKPMEVEGSQKSKDDFCYMSMGIFAIKRDVMVKLLTAYFPKANDLGSEVITGAISMGLKVQAYIYDGYWEDMGTIEAFYRANMESTRKTTSGFNFFDRDSPLYTLPRNLPPTTMTDAMIVDSVIGDGCIFNRCKVKGSVIGMRTWIGDGAVVEDSVVMGSDIYQMEGVKKSRMDKHGMDIPIGVGEKSHIRKAIIDKNAHIGKSVKIMNRDNVQEGNREDRGYIISGGIVIVLRSAVIPDGSIL
ncbi:inactive glucose-1-phosphate adenylyltransferase small subunit 2, chloroplastic-like isoform X2 [Magnolia sinica]|uniref:inactive glucose-1-phosphate adenylyltransferase small subunit 2, chloroplastic-like isoform X2 n=1 Tax=Magnolia sinica TaxID=86752 RepID=UPI002658F362|nr:inactive glucose-1-phosphate adenylyltransferase small subunit 2, chloroplastic-like isoform X2 [Magnolia sinica]XP_058101863.1 inactive glucose-1-phosphate adenylyltransferase small subunit 2, chloroplastic-like isoform X2 [Magnolia sinica]